MQENKVINKRIAIFLVFIFSCTFVQAQENILYDHSEIESLSSFRIQGVIDLRFEKDVSSPIDYRTLNHEGGMKVTVLEVLNRDIYENNEGIWLYVLLTSPMWVEDGTWIEKYKKFMIFLPDDMPVFEFEK